LRGKRKLLFVPVIAVVAATLVGLFAAPAAAAVNYGRFTHQGTNECLDMKAEDSFTVQQWSCIGGDAQQAWQVSFVSNFGTSTAYYNIINKKNGLCMGVINDPVNPAPVQMESCQLDPGSLWSFQNTLNGNNQVVSNIHNLNTNFCLDVQGNSGANGAIVQQYPCNGTSAQNWIEANFS
jgi:hypothetical protein